MQFLNRSLTTTGALLIAVVICLLAAAGPLEQQAGTAANAQQLAAAPQLRQAVDDAPTVSPISLADADGQELILESLSVRTAIHGMLSLTEIDFRFRNPKPQRIEGRFAFSLPPNAAISRFAKDVNGALMEGEVVERLRANQVYEQYLHVMRDPALLEQDQGNRFSARIFPIEGNAPVQLVLSYTQLLPLRNGVRTYEMPLRGLAKVGKFAFHAYVSPLPGEEAVGAVRSQSGVSLPSGATRSTAEVFTIEENDYTPTRDIELSWRPSADAVRTRVLKAGDFYLAAFTPSPGARVANAVSHDGWIFYVDTSASSAEGADHRIRALERLLASLRSRDRVRLFAFDNDVAPLANGTAGELSRSIGGLLRTRLFLGGTDIVSMLRHVNRTSADHPRHAIVIASDLVATLGAAERKDVVDTIRTIPTRTTIHALILGNRQEAAVAKALTAGRGRVVTIPFSEAIDARAQDAAVELQRPLGASFDVSDSAAEWVYPTHFDDVQQGDEIIVLGKRKAGSEPAVLLSGAGATMTATNASTLPAGTFGPLLEREAYRAYLEYLAEREVNEPSDAVRRALGTEQTRISIEQRVVIPRTTMLVLENEWEYQRFGLDRRALAAILTIGAGGIERIDRRSAELRPMPPMPVPVAPMRPTPEARRQKATVGNAPPPPPVVQTAPTAGAAAAADVALEAQEQPAPAPEAFRKEVASGSVAGGAVGGVIGGVQTIDAPPPPPSTPPPPPPPPPAPERDASSSTSSRQRRAMPRPPVPPTTTKQSDTTWTRDARPSRERIDELESALRTNPRDRERWNQLSEVYASLGEWSTLRSLALRWQPYDPENPQVYEVLGMADERLGNEGEAARAYASLIEVATSKPELLQRAGLLLVRARKARLAETPLRRALELRPDRVNTYRHLALMLWLDGRPEEAARVLESATRQQFQGWYGNAQRVVREELGYVYRAWIAKEPERRTEIAARAREHAVDLERRDALRVTLAWETDANDVDLHVVDPSGDEAFYGNHETRSGLRFYEDITQGLGPEVIVSDRVQRGTYHIGVRYFAAGPMGVSRGIVVVMRGDGDEPTIDIHPFRLVQGGAPVRRVATVTVTAVK